MAQITFLLVSLMDVLHKPAEPSLNFLIISVNCSKYILTGGISSSNVLQVKESKCLLFFILIYFELDVCLVASVGQK